MSKRGNVPWHPCAFDSNPNHALPCHFVFPGLPLTDFKHFSYVANKKLFMHHGLVNRHGKLGANHDKGNALEIAAGDYPGRWC